VEDAEKTSVYFVIIAGVFSLQRYTDPELKICVGAEMKGLMGVGAVRFALTMLQQNEQN